MLQEEIFARGRLLLLVRGSDPIRQRLLAGGSLDIFLHFVDAEARTLAQSVWLCDTHFAWSQVLLTALHSLLLWLRRAHVQTSACLFLDGLAMSLLRL